MSQAATHILPGPWSSFVGIPPAYLRRLLSPPVARMRYLDKATEAQTTSDTAKKREQHGTGMHGNLNR